MTYEEMYTTLHERFPKLITKDTCVDVDVGWYQIVYDYCEMIEKLVNKRVCKYVPIIQFKEKFGKLRIAHAINSDEIGANICRAIEWYTEAKSGQTCEKCGKWGEIDYEMGWLKCLCSECREEIKR